jgi:hypothetical protein
MALPTVVELLENILWTINIEPVLWRLLKGLKINIILVEGQMASTSHVFEISQRSILISLEDTVIKVAPADQVRTGEDPLQELDLILKMN